MGLEGLTQMKASLFARTLPRPSSAGSSISVTALLSQASRKPSTMTKPGGRHSTAVHYSPAASLTTCMALSVLPMSHVMSAAMNSTAWCVFR